MNNNIPEKIPPQQEGKSKPNLNVLRNSVEFLPERGQALLYDSKILASYAIPLHQPDYKLFVETRAKRKAFYKAKIPNYPPWTDEKGKTKKTLTLEQEGLNQVLKQNPLHALNLDQIPYKTFDWYLKNEQNCALLLLINMLVNFDIDTKDGVQWKTKLEKLIEKQYVPEDVLAKHLVVRTSVQPAKLKAKYKQTHLEGCQLPLYVDADITDLRLLKIIHQRRIQDPIVKDNFFGVSGVDWLAGAGSYAVAPESVTEKGKYLRYNPAKKLEPFYLSRAPKLLALFEAQVPKNRSQEVVPEKIIEQVPHPPLPPASPVPTRNKDNVLLINQPHIKIEDLPKTILRLDLEGIAQVVAKDTNRNDWFARVINRNLRNNQALLYERDNVNEACQIIYSSFPEELKVGFSSGELEGIISSFYRENYQTAEENCHGLLQTINPGLEKYLILRPTKEGDNKPEYSFRYDAGNIRFTCSNARHAWQVATSFKLCIDERHKKIKINQYVWIEIEKIVSLSVYAEYEKLAKTKAVFEHSNLIATIDERGYLSEPKINKGKDSKKHTVLMKSQGGYGKQIYDTMAVFRFSDIGLLDLAHEKKEFNKIELDRFANPRTFPTAKFNRCLRQNPDVVFSEWLPYEFEFPDAHINPLPPAQRPQNIKNFPFKVKEDKKKCT
jgi:hypothetical protein